MKKSDKEKLKSQPQVEEEPDDTIAAQVDDSDDEPDRVSTVVEDHVPEVVSTPTPVVVEQIQEPVVAKKKVVKKKTDA